MSPPPPPPAALPRAVMPAAAVPIEHVPSAAPAHAPVAAAAEFDVGGSEPEQEENIYEVMKQHMARKKEELDAQNAQLKQPHRPGQRPGPVIHAPPVPPPIDKAPDLADLAGVWIAARNYLSNHARLLESVLGNCSQISAFNVSTSDITLTIPNTQRNFTNDKARAKLEEALRAVTDLPLKVVVNFVDPPEAPPGSQSMGGPGGAPLAAAQRVPPEVMEAVKKQPVIRELMKRLDATVTQVEMLDEVPPEV